MIDNMRIKDKNIMKKRKGISRDSVELGVLCTPAVLHLLLFSYLPMVGIIIAFKDFRYDLGMFKSEWCGLENFEFFFKSQDAWNITYNTLFLNALGIFCGLVFAVFFALLLFEVRKKFLIKTYQTIMILPNFISWVVVGCMTYALLNPELGMVNGILKALGFEGINWYQEPAYWPAILTIASVWKNTGMSCIVYYAALMSIDNEFYEAARLDGANKAQMMRYISIPGIKSVIIIMLILALGGIFRADFGLFYQLTRNVSALYPTTDVIDTYVFRALKTQGNVSLSAAIGLFQSLVGFVLILTANLVTKKLSPESELF